MIQFNKQYNLIMLEAILSMKYYGWKQGYEWQTYNGRYYTV